MRVIIIVAASLLLCGGIIACSVRTIAGRLVRMMREAMSDPKLWGD